MTKKTSSGQKKKNMGRPVTAARIGKTPIYKGKSIKVPPHVYIIAERARIAEEQRIGQAIAQKDFLAFQIQEKLAKNLTENGDSLGQRVAELEPLIESWLEDRWNHLWLHPEDYAFLFLCVQEIRTKYPHIRGVNTFRGVNASNLLSAIVLHKFGYLSTPQDRAIAEIPGQRGHSRLDLLKKKASC
jgi:hypothetical protein